MQNSKYSKNRRALICITAVLSTALVAGSPLTALAAATEYTYDDYRSGSGYTALGNEDDYTVIEISNEDELRELAGNCVYDAWSRDKYVKLTGDIALSEDLCLSIPSFGGIFDGNGFRITNLYIDDTGSAVGLFRYIQESGIVRNLTVEGKVVPEGSQDQVGGIVGVNFGQIINVSFSGQVSGDTEVGGIAGVNEKSGQIRRCVSGAAVAGNHSTGGITGSNHGILNNCSNTGDINIHSTEVSYDLEDITMENFEDINSTSNVSAHTDTGGVAGISDGKIYFCTNEGTVGYSHVGYNIGGIVGRLHQGYIQNCTNSGHVYGRKDVAGIAGQMEPFLQVEYLEDTIGKIGTQTDVFLNMLEKSQKDLSNYVDNAADLSRNLTDSLRGATDSGSDALNSTNDALYLYNQELGNIADSGKELVDSVTNRSESGESITVGDVSIDIPTDVSKDSEAYKAALSKFGTDVVDSASNAADQAGEISGDVKDSLGNMNSSMGSAQDYLDELVNTLDNGNTTVSNDVSALVNQAKYLRSLIGDLRTDLFEYEGFSVEDTSDEEASAQSQEAGYDPSLGELMYDTSSFQQGKITLCENKGNVEADTNVGGIVGLVATEYDMDPEDDITLTGEESFNIEQTIKAIIRDSKNYADVTAKKDFVGGIVGKAEFGASISCESYGDIESTNGNYVGGIAGSSSYSVRSCYSTGKLTGKSYVGGVTGIGCDIFYSYAYNDFDTAGEYVGSIAGQVRDEGTLYGNYYVEGKPGGVDGIGYEGGAVPISYEEFSSIEDIPENFRKFTVVFKADDEVLGTVEASYGSRIDISELPDIPEKDGCYGVWPADELEFVTGNTVVEAEYDKWVTALKSEATDEDGRAKLLVEGSFLPEYRLKAEIGEGIGSDITFEIVDDETGEAVYSEPVEVRILCDEPKKTESLIKNEDGTYTKASTSVMGKYLVFQMDKPGTFKLAKVVNYGLIMKVAAAVCIIVLVVVILLVRKRVKKRRAKKNEQKAIEQAEVVSDDAEQV